MSFSLLRFKKATFLTSSALIASFALFSLPAQSFAADASLADVPHASDIQPEIAKKIPTDDALKSALESAISQVKEGQKSLKTSANAHKKGQASADEISTHKEALSDNLSALDEQIKQIQAAPKSKIHDKWLVSANAVRNAAQKMLDNAQ
ncbi:hypothetical protein FAI40_09335 [Acetobacteraceae bacterium]|nr:hypothetical protein FAI40_09335 [Acetobacteraceae bacterium]